MITVYPVKGRDGRWGEIVPVPHNNEYGRFRLYQRTDGQYVVFDPHDPNEVVITAPVFASEGPAREWAKAMASGRACRRCGDALMPEELETGCSACTGVAA